MKAKDATDVSMPSWADHEGFFMQGQLLDMVYKILMEVPAALFDGILPAGYFQQDVDKAFGEYGSAYVQKLAANLPEIFLNSGYVFGDKGDERVLERLLQFVRGAGADRYLQLLLEANGLKKVGKSWYSEYDGYEYFEVNDGKGGPTMLCRVYRGDVKVLHQGIEIFLDARTDGVPPNQVPDPNYTAKSSGTLGDLQAKVIDRASYLQWLAAHPRRIRTKYLDEFYTHYAYPAT